MQIERRFVEEAARARSGSDLHEVLQLAIQLEHATIPPYLVAAYSLNGGVSSEIQSIITDIAREEMLHMAIVANILVAVGGYPRFDAPGFIPTYPGPLPMNVGSGLTVGLKRFSKELVRDVFMQIEKPENPLDFPVSLEVLGVEAPSFATIGQFYGTLIATVEELGDEIFVGDPSRQVVVDAGFPSEQLFRITDAASAVRALRWIMQEGEGTPTDPLDPESEAAHYYRFAEIFHGRKLKKAAELPHGYAYAGNEIRFDAADVLGIPDNATAVAYAEGTTARKGVDAFNLEYCNMLRSTQHAFAVDPREIGAALAHMGRVRRIAATVVRLRDGAGRNLPLTFEYMPPVTR